MFLEHLGARLRNKGGNPDRRFEASLTNRLQHALRITAECSSGVEPVAHRGLIPVVDLHVLQSGDLPGDYIEVIENLLCRDTGSETIPGAPSCGRGTELQWRMIPIHVGREVRKQDFVIVAGRVMKVLEFPGLS